MTRRLRGRAARFTVAGALAVGVLTAFAAVAGVGLSQIRSDGHQYGQYQYGQNKVVICHHTHSKKHPFVTLSVGASAAQAHLKHHHGDHLGACTAANPSSGQSKGKTDDHGKGNDQGKDHDDNGHGQGQGQGKGKGHGK
jgi:hypothetical protein